MSKPKVLVFIDWFLPGTKAGGPVRSCANLVDHLSGQIEFSIVTTDTDYTEKVPYQGEQSDQWTMLEGGGRVWYCSKKGVNKANFKKLIKEKEYDAYYINGLYSKYFSILPLRLLKKQKRNAKVIVAVRGMLASGAMQFSTLKKKSFIRVAKLTGLYNGVIFQATNEVEEADIRLHIDQKVNIELIPNLARNFLPVNAPIEKKGGELKIVCLARIAIEKNTQFAIERVSNVHGIVQLDLCGVVYDQDHWSSCKRIIEGLPANVIVDHIDGIEGDQVPELLSKYHLMFLPTLGENFGHVIFESLSVGRPVIISDRTPWQGLEEQNAGFVLSLNESAKFENALQKFTDMAQEEYDGWCKGAFDFALRYLERDNTDKKYLELFKS